MSASFALYFTYLHAFVISKHLHKPKFHLARHVSTRHDTFDVSRASRRACRAVRFDKLDTAKMHGLDTSNASCRAVTWRGRPSGICAITVIESTSGLRRAIDFVLQFPTNFGFVSAFVVDDKIYTRYRVRVLPGSVYRSIYTLINHHTLRGDVDINHAPFCRQRALLGLALRLNLPLDCVI